MSVAPILFVVAAAVTAVGALAAGQASANRASQNAQLLQQQAAIEDQNAQTAYERKKREGLILRGRSLAVLSASGVDPSEGSPLELVSEQAKENEFQAESVRYQYRDKAWRLRMGAAQQELAGQDALTQSYFQAGSAILGGGAKAYGAGGFDFLKGGSGPPTESPSAPGSVNP